MEERRNKKMPVLFVGHGSPMNAVEDNRFSRAWSAMAASLPKPEAILCISAHWVTDGTGVTAMKTPRTIHDFYGFPEALYQMQYPAPGSPEVAALIQAAITSTSVSADLDWGLDHGTWSVLCRMFPRADIPVLQLSLDRTKDPVSHYKLADELRGLRDRGILIVGSGNMIHNLGIMTWEEKAYDWAVQFDALLTGLLRAGKYDEIIRYQSLGPAAALAIPTDEHYLPLIYALGASNRDDQLSFFAEHITLGSISMRSLRLG